MDTQVLAATAQALLSDDKGLLAMDESNATCNQRFARLGIPQTVEARRAWRELLVCTPGLADSIAGAILFDETIHQQKADGTSFVAVLKDAGIIAGIKVDTGAKALAGVIPYSPKDGQQAVIFTLLLNGSGVSNQGAYRPIWTSLTEQLAKFSSRPNASEIAPLPAGP